MPVSVGFGDICPGETDTNGKLFLLLFSLMGLGMFGGPILQLGAAWRHAIPGGVGSVAAFLLGLGVTIFTAVEGLDHFEAVYASIITGEYLLVHLEDFDNAAKHSILRLNNF